MKAISPELRSLLSTRQFYAADLYTFVLSNGQGTFRWSSGDQDITWNGRLYSATSLPGGPYFDRTSNKAKVHQKIGTDVDTMVFDVLPGNATVLGLGFLAACRQGIFDGATMTLHRAFMPNYGNTASGAVQMFNGRIAEVDFGRSIATFTVNSWIELLNQQFPRNLWQPGCVNNLGDSTCQVNLSAFSLPGLVVVTSSTVMITANFNAQQTGYFDLGKIVFTSGSLTGVSRSIKSSVQGIPGTINLAGPLTVAASVGDVFTMFAGCDKSLGSNGCPKFANQARFRGAPFIPQPITAI